MARPRIAGVERIPCPLGHEGKILLDGKNLTRDGMYERTRFRCVPKDEGEKAHVFLETLSHRRSAGHKSECLACERTFDRGEGYAGAWHFAYAIREIAQVLIKIGQGKAYRPISQKLRDDLGRTIKRGPNRGKLSQGGQLAMDYLDIFAPIVLAQVSPARWPQIVAVDALPVRAISHAKCCPKYVPPPRALQPRRFDVLIDELGDRVLVPATTSPVRKPKRTRPKLQHAGEITEVGQILVAMGQHTVGEKPKMLMARFVGAGDEMAWVEFLTSLPGKPDWIVSDRARAIMNAVRYVWGTSVTHYFCETHIAKNIAAAAKEDGLEPDHNIYKLIEHCQENEASWELLATFVSVAGYTHLEKWFRRNRKLWTEQNEKRKERRRWDRPRSAGACEAGIGAVKNAIRDRIPYFRNATRLNLMLALVASELNLTANEVVYSKAIRSYLEQFEGHANPYWAEIRDPIDLLGGSMKVAVDRAAEMASDYGKLREAARRAARYQARKTAIDAERREMGLIVRRREDLEPRERPTESIAGKTVADFPKVAAQWHPDKNGELRPEDVTAGSSMFVWWKCPEGPDHEWEAKVASRVYGARCRFCTGRAVAPSESLAVTHPDIAAQWHRTKNGLLRPDLVSYGSTRQVWWQCDKYKSHVWRAQVRSRTGVIPSGCRHCAAMAGKGVPMTEESQPKEEPPQITETGQDQAIA